MIQETRMLFMYVETPLHVGSGRGLGAVDLPIQRERTTNYPIVQASSLKGRMRGEAYARYEPFTKRFEELKMQFVNQIATDEKDKERAKKQAENRARRQAAQETGLEAIFGPEAGEGASEHAGAISFGDARVLLFPVRSLAGVFAWTTSVDALERFKRAAQIAKIDFGVSIPEEPCAEGTEWAWVSGDALKAGESVVLEEFSFAPREKAAVANIGVWLALHALPQTDAYKYWRETLSKRLCILSDNAFRDFVQYGTEVQTHVKLDVEKKTVEKGALWTSESLPTDTLLYAPVMATKTRDGKTELSAADVLNRIDALKLDRTQLGGDETTGQGFVALRFSNGGGE